MKFHLQVLLSGPNSSLTEVKYFALVCLVLAGCSSSEKVSTRARQAASAVLQNHDPVNALDLYLVGFHPMKDDPAVQMEAHHYCREISNEVAQCVLFDGNDKTSKLNGIEYIIAGHIYESFPEEEKKFWHPHNYEILSGQLVAPGVPDAAEKQMLRTKMNSYGKTFHFEWHKTLVPLGDPKLAWSFTQDGQLRPDLLTSRDQRLSINAWEKRKQRQELSALVQSPH